MSDPVHRQAQRLEMERLLRENGAEAVIAKARSVGDPGERVVAWSIAQRAAGECMTCDLDGIIAVVHAGIADDLAQATHAADEGMRRNLVDAANVLSYNLSAALADCWPNDTRLRERRHLEAGLAAANDCLRWREELGKGPFPFSIAWWAKGIHLLSLGRVPEAEDAFERALVFAEEHVGSSGGSIGRDATGDWSVLLSWGYLEIARTRRTGDRSGFLDAMTALEAAIASRPQEADDLQFTADQLQCAFERHAMG
jgi:hypothetical protein